MIKTKATKCLVIAVMSLSSLALASTKQSMKIQVVAPTEDRAVKYRKAGLVGAFEGTKTSDVVFMVNAIINGDHARLKCFENHRGCTALGPGDYDAEIEKDNVWIVTTVPVTHKVIRDHWKVSGSW
jgi:hypothetical protein